MSLGSLVNFSETKVSTSYRLGEVEKVCGIVGYAGVNSEAGDISSMVAQIGHRGPDQLAYKKFGHAAIGVSRLSIVDLENGSQPMVTPNGRYWIVFNGEIYNHKELAKSFAEELGSLTTSSDTEVVLRLYEIFGSRCVQKLRGMFAFCIYDKFSGRLFIARDRFGVKPLYYYFKNGKFFFSSEFKMSFTENLKISKGVEVSSVVTF